MNDVNFVSLPRTAAISRRVRGFDGADLKELLGLIVHQDDVRPLVGHEDRIGDVLEDEVEAIAFAAHGDFRVRGRAALAARAHWRRGAGR